MDLLYKIVRRLLRDDDVDFSRNRNYEAYDDPMVRRAVRIYRHLRSVEKDLLAAEDGDVELTALERSGSRIVVRLALESGDGRRESFLEQREWDMLLESDRVSGILHRLLDDAPRETQKILVEE